MTETTPTETNVTRRNVIAAGPGVAVLAILPALALAGSPASTQASPHPPNAKHQFAATPDPIGVWPLVPPAPAVDDPNDFPTEPLVDPLEIVPLPLPRKVEIIRWKKAPVRRPRQADYLPQAQTFNAYIRGSQRTSNAWSIAGLRPEPGLCSRSSTRVSVVWGSTGPVPVVVGATSWSVPNLPVRFSVAIAHAGAPDRASCFSADTNPETCSFEGRGIPGRASIAVDGNKVTLAGLTVDSGGAGSTCTGLFGWPGVVEPPSSPMPFAVASRASLHNRAKAKVVVSKAYSSSGTQATEGECKNESTSYRCGWTSSTQWDLLLVRAPQVRLSVPKLGR